MPKIKGPSVAGQFYTADPKELQKQLRTFVEKQNPDRKVTSRLVIAPHAGYIYSGQLMSESIGYLPQEIKNVFIIAPAHRLGFAGLALSSFDRWRTPLGEIELNTKIVKELATEEIAYFNDEAFTQEHAVEVEVPFLQINKPEGLQIIPILVGRVAPELITQVIERYYDDPENGFVISSDLSHFLSDMQAKRVDAETARMIETGNITQFHSEQACGALSILGAVAFASKRGFSMIRIGMKNSAVATGDFSRVVGYGSWFLYEGSKEHFLKQFHSKLLLDIAKRSIEHGLQHKSKLSLAEFKELPSVLKEYGACFVTLEIEKRLRGCIGSIIAQTAFIDDLLSNAWNAAFGDPRFLPLTQKEFEAVSIAISLLSAPTPLQFENENELLDKIQPFRDGLIIADRGARAVYLPSVWEQLPDKVEFLKNLKVKAGLRPDHFSSSFEAFVFTTEYIKDGDGE